MFPQAVTDTEMSPVIRVNVSSAVRDGPVLLYLIVQRQNKQETTLKDLNINIFKVGSNPKTFS